MKKKTNDLENKMEYHIQHCYKNNGDQHSILFNGKWYCTQAVTYYCIAQRKSDKPAPYCGKRR